MKLSVNQELYLVAFKVSTNKNAKRCTRVGVSNDLEKNYKPFRQNIKKIQLLHMRYYSSYTLWLKNSIRHMSIRLILYLEQTSMKDKRFELNQIPFMNRVQDNSFVITSSTIL